MAFELIRKPIRYCEVKTQREKRMSEVTKNEHLRSMVDTCSRNQPKPAEVQLGAGGHRVRFSGEYESYQANPAQGLYHGDEK